LISLTKDTDNTNTWIAELIPEKGEYQASIAVSLGNLTMIFPLTIAPKINIDFTESGQASKTGFDRYIKKLRASKSSKSVLNREGKWSYRDDYILTANFLAATMKLQGPK
jgi:glycine cleavage system protein P-like pyridoxal-binding family